MATIKTDLICNLNQPVNVTYLHGNLFSQDNAGNTINVFVMDNGEPATIGGTVSANVIRSDGQTVAVSGAIEGNKAYVILPQACYAVPGVVHIIIKLTQSTTVTTIAAVVANVYMSTTDAVIDPGTVIPSIQALMALIEEAVDSIPTDYTGLLHTIAADYSSSKTYKVGDYAWESGVLKRCIVPITAAETYTAAHWTNAVIGDDLTNLKSALTKSTGSNIIQFIDNYYIKTNLTTGATVDLTPVYNVSLAYAVIDVIPGQIIKLNAAGWSTGRLWCFIDSDNKLLSVSASTVVATDLILVVPKNSAKCVLNSYKANVGICLYGTIPSYQINQLYTKIDNDFEVKLGNLNDDVFELGDISISDNSWVWQASNTRARLKKGVVFNLNVGDVIGLRDYSAYRYYIGWIDASGTYHREGWLSANKTITQAGQYVVVIRNNPESSTTINYTDLSDLFFGFTTISYVDNNFVNNATELMLPHDYHVKSINHRGYMSTAPENTLPAYQLSRKMGYKYVETDVAFTSDGVAVLLHDTTINRTAKNADGTSLSSDVYINDITYENALNYVFCGTKYSAYPTVKIPTLLQFMTLCRNAGLMPYVEIKTLKSGAYPSQAQIEGIIDIVKSCGMIDKTTWISFDATSLGYVKSYSPKSRIGYLVSGINATIIQTANGLKTTDNEVFIDSESYTDTEVNLCIQAGIPIEVWTIDAASAITAMNPYISGVTTNLINAGQILLNDAMS